MSDIKSLATASLNAFTTGDMEGFVGMMHPECEWVAPEGSAFAGKYNGPQEIVQKFFMPLAEVLDFKMVVERLDVVSDEEVLVRGRYHAKHRESGRAAVVPFLSLVQWRDGKLRRHEDFFDTHTARVDLPA